ncbi:MAG: CoA-binding protein [Candidatus Lokiarchaeota archaeon]|nr:CoA-binding protein [Candidatus Lokiarchaeota archaeon]
MTVNLDFFTEPTSVVLYGISRKVGKTGYFIATNMISYNPRHLYVIHPEAQEVHGIPCVKKFKDLPRDIRNSIDLAIISVPVPFVTDAILECIHYNVKGIIVGSGNLGLTDIDAANNEMRIITALKKQLNTKTRIIGPNALGVFNNENKFFTAIMTMEDYPPFTSNSVAIIAQTGLMVSGYLIDFLERKDIGISKIFAIGNKFDINECDVLEYLLDDSNTKVIAMYLESIVEGTRFFHLCKTAINEKGKILILLKPGKSNLAKQAILSHTKSIAGNADVIRAMCSQLGIIQVEDLQEFIQACKLTSNIPLPLGNSAGLISISGAGCVLLADLAEEYDFTIHSLSEKTIHQLKSVFPEWVDISHPLDIWASIEQFQTKSYNVVLESFLSAGYFDFIVMCNIGGVRTGMDFEYIRKLRIKYPKIPIILQIFGGFQKKKQKFSSEFELVGSEDYIPVMYDLRRIMKILSKMVKLKNKLKRNC